ncbi:hypothetical protein D3C84_662550 [compost metagenome]
MTIVAVDQHRITDLVQGQQQVAPGRVDLGVDVPLTELLALGQDVGRLVAVDVEVKLPGAYDDQTAQGGDAEPGDQQPPLAAGHLDIVARQTCFGVDHPLEQLLGKVDHRAAGRFDFGWRWRQLIGLPRFFDESVAHGALLQHRGKIQPAHQRRGGETIAAEHFAQESKQRRS